MKYVLFVILGIVGVIVLLLLIALVKTLCTPKKTSAFMPFNQPEREEAYAKKLSEMVKCETVSKAGVDRRDRFLAFHEILEELFPLVHKNLEKTEIDGNLIFHWKGKSADKPIILMSHQDVVAAEGKWIHAPFSGDIADGKVWGRGSADTKCSLMAFFQAVEELIGDGFVPENDVYLCSSCTEEVGGDGAPKIVKELKARGIKPFLVCDEGGAIITEPLGGIKGYFAMIGVLEKGHGNLCFSAKSNGGHSSYPPKNSPIARLAALVQDVEKHNPMKSRMNKEAQTMFENLAPYGPFYLRYLFGNLWLFKPLLCKLMPSISAQGAALLRTTVAFTMQSGSDGYNVLPQEAKLFANLRYIPHQPMAESHAVMQRLADKYDLKMSVVNAEDCCKPIDFKGDAYKMVERAINKTFPDMPVSPYVMTGGTDARFYQEICDNCIRFAPIIFGPEQMKGMHGLNENVDTVSLPGAVDFYKTVIQSNT